MLTSGRNWQKKRPSAADLDLRWALTRRLPPLQVSETDLIRRPVWTHDTTTAVITKD
jgi:hypothetical protein